MADNEPQVLGEPTPGVADATTPTEGGVTAPVTTTIAPSDAEKLREDYESLKSKYEKDISGVKSSLQRREAQLTAEFKQREKSYKEEIDRIRASTMDEDERKIYEQEMGVRRMQELEEQVSELSREREQADAAYRAYVYFTRNGIEASRLILDQGYDDLYQSGMQAMEEDLRKLRSAPPQSPPVPPTPPEPPKAPAVVTTTGTPAGIKPTWDDLIAKYGSREEVYSLIEQKRLPVDILPV